LTVMFYRSVWGFCPENCPLAGAGDSVGKFRLHTVMVMWVALPSNLKAASLVRL